MIKFCFIAPKSGFSIIENEHVHLVLAHLLEKDEEYCSFYRRLSDRGDYIIMDNSAFELYQQKKPMFPADKLISLGKSVGATTIVLPDYPNQHSGVTEKSGKYYAPMFKAEGFQTMFVPQSRFADLNDYINCFMRAIQNPLFDYIGVSIIGVPNAMGVSPNDKLQRFLSRWHLLNLIGNCSYDSKVSMIKKLHFLGMTDGPNEIKLVQKYHNLIYSWDSSSAIWAGCCGVLYDDSPTGLLTGKIEFPVDFNIAMSDNCISIAKSNVSYIKGLL